jgi:hypothetical protein
MKTSELTGKALNWAVNYAEGLRGIFAPVDYSGEWEHGGPIIERERIATGFDGFDIFDSALPIWGACKYDSGFEGYGPTPLIAAMRCYVASKLGDDVDVPELP